MLLYGLSLYKNEGSARVKYTLMPTKGEDPRTLYNNLDKRLGDFFADTEDLETGGFFRESASRVGFSTEAGTIYRSKSMPYMRAGLKARCRQRNGKKTWEFFVNFRDTGNEKIINENMLSLLDILLEGNRYTKNIEETLKRTRLVTFYKDTLDL